MTVVENYTNKCGRKEGVKYIGQDMRDFMWSRDLFDMASEHPWILKELKLVENTQLTKSPGRANYEENAIEMSSKVFDGPVATQRSTFIKVIAHFLALKEFDTTTGDAYKLFVARYMKTNKPNLSNNTAEHRLNQ